MEILKLRNSLLPRKKEVLRLKHIKELYAKFQLYWIGIFASPQQSLSVGLGLNCNVQTRQGYVPLFLAVKSDIYLVS